MSVDSEGKLVPLSLTEETKSESENDEEAGEGEMNWNISHQFTLLFVCFSKYPVSKVVQRINIEWVTWKVKDEVLI